MFDSHHLWAAVASCPLFLSMMIGAFAKERHSRSGFAWFAITAALGFVLLLMFGDVLFPDLDRSQQSQPWKAAEWRSVGESALLQWITGAASLALLHLSSGRNAGRRPHADDRPSG